MARNSLKSVCRLLNETTAKMPVEKGFLADLQRSIEISANNEQRQPSRAYKPSSMNCIRNMYFQRTGVEVVGDADYLNVGICNTGSDTHQRIQEAVCKMKANGMDCEYVDVAKYIKSRKLNNIEIVSNSDFEKGIYETKLFHNELQMSFLCDGIIKYKGHYYILEIKTEKSYKWQARKGVDESHYKQGTAYSIAFNIPEVLFVYINRDSMDMKSYLFVPTDEMKNELIGTIDACEQCVKKSMVPSKPENLNRKACQYCNYVEECRKYGD